MLSHTLPLFETRWLVVPGYLACKRLGALLSLPPPHLRFLEVQICTRQASFMGSQRLKKQSQSLHGTATGPLHTSCGCSAWGVCESLLFACSRDPFPTTGLTYPALSWGFVPSIMHLDMLGSLFFSKGKWRSNDYRRGEYWEEWRKGRLPWKGIVWEKNKYKGKWRNLKLSVVAHPCNSSTQEAGGSLEV